MMRRVGTAMRDAQTALWLGRRLWRPVTAELLRERAERRARRGPRRRT